MKFKQRLINLFFKVFYGLSFSTYKACHTNRSFDSMSSILLWMTHAIKKKYPNFDVSDKIVGEIGAGQFLSHPIGFKLLGASKIISFDLYREFNQKAALLSYYQQIMSKKIFSSYASPSIYIKAMEDIKSTKLDLKQLKLYGIEYLAPFDIHQYEKNNYFDLITSYTVLEHVPLHDIKKLLENSIRLLKIEGYFCHYIDLEDHKDPENQPFDFLKVDKWSDSDCFSRGNRLRLNDWENIFSNIHGIEYEFTSILERNQELLPQGIEKEFNNFVSGILVVGKKTLS